VSASIHARRAQRGHQTLARNPTAFEQVVRALTLRRIAEHVRNSTASALHGARGHTQRASPQSPVSDLDLTELHPRPRARIFSFHALQSVAPGEKFPLSCEMEPMVSRLPAFL
jgi:hypothetical protein